MNHRMVLAALGAPESKVREKESGDTNGSRYEEWIYGHVPQTVKFVRFKGDRVAQLQIAALGKPIELHDKNELEEGDIPSNTRQIAMGDKVPGREGEDGAAPAAPPSLRLPGEASEPVNAQGKVQYPDKDKDKDKDKRLDRQPIPAAPGSPADTSMDDPQQQQTSPIPSASQSGSGYPNQNSPYPQRPGDPYPQQPGGPYPQQQTQPGAPYPQNTPGQPRSRTQP